MALCQFTGKLCHRTRKAAKQYRRLTRALDRDAIMQPATLARVYRCPFCHTWHVGHPPLWSLSN